MEDIKNQLEKLGFNCYSEKPNRLYFHFHGSNLFIQVSEIESFESKAYLQMVGQEKASMMSQITGQWEYQGIQTNFATVVILGDIDCKDMVLQLIPKVFEKHAQKMTEKYTKLINGNEETV